MGDKNKRETPRSPGDATATFELLLEEREREFFVLRLYISGMTARSQRAISNIRKICNQHLDGRYQLEIIDIYQHPELARERQIIAAPTLVKELPLPLRRFIGDLSRLDRILIDLNIKTRE